MRAARSVIAALAGPTQTGGATSRLTSIPTAAPISVSRTRSHAVFATWVTPRTSMALIATSGTNSSTRTRWPTSRDARMTRPRLHQVRPTSALKPIAIRTPATTEFTLRMAVVSVE